MALTLSPRSAAIIIKTHHGEKNRAFRAFESGFERLQKGFLAGVAAMLRGDRAVAYAC